MKRTRGKEEMKELRGIKTYQSDTLDKKVTVPERDPAEEGMAAARRENFVHGARDDLKSYLRLLRLLEKHLDGKIVDWAGDNEVELEFFRDGHLEKKWFTHEEMIEILAFEIYD